MFWTSPDAPVRPPWLKGIDRDELRDLLADSLALQSALRMVSEGTTHNYERLSDAPGGRTRADWAERRAQGNAGFYARRDLKAKGLCIDGPHPDRDGRPSPVSHIAVTRPSRRRKRAGGWQAPPGPPVRMVDEWKRKLLRCERPAQVRALNRRTWRELRAHKTGNPNGGGRKTLEVAILTAKGVRYVTLADRLGVDWRVVWGTRREHGQEPAFGGSSAVARPRGTCRECGGPMGHGYGKDGVCRSCSERITTVEWSQLADLKRRGIPDKEIAAQTGRTHGSVRATLSRMRKLGWDVPTDGQRSSSTPREC